MANEMKPNTLHLQHWGCYVNFSVIEKAKELLETNGYDFQYSETTEKSVHDENHSLHVATTTYEIHTNSILTEGFGKMLLDSVEDVEFVSFFIPEQDECVWYIEE